MNVLLLLSTALKAHIDRFLTLKPLAWLGIPVVISGPSAIYPIYRPCMAEQLQASFCDLSHSNDRLENQVCVCTQELKTTLNNLKLT